MKTIVETSAYMLIFIMISLVSIDFIRMNKKVSDADQMSQYIQNYIETYCGEYVIDTADEEDTVYIPDREAVYKSLKNTAANAGMKLDLKEEGATGNYRYIAYDLEYCINAAMFRYSSEHTIKGLARYAVIS